MQKRLKSLSILGFVLISFSAVKAQDSTQAFGFIKFQYAYFLPSGDFEDRYENANSIGGEIGFKNFGNWQLSFSGAYLFSSRVKVNNLLDDVINANGDAIDSDGELVRLTYELRGQSYFLKVGRIFNEFLSPNPNSGFLLTAGVGYLRHRIKVDYRDGTVYQLSEDRLKGYDRLSSGIAFNQFIGYQYYGKSNLFNFYLGLELMQAFTKNRRKYNYDSRSFDAGNKSDYFAGLRFGWVIPFRKRRAEEFYYY